MTAHVKVQVRPDFTGGFDINPLDFYGKVGSAHFGESDGNAFEAPGNSREIQANTLGAGESETGTLVFDMPAQHGKIGYAPNFNGQALGYWKY